MPGEKETMNAVLVYVTTSSHEEATMIGRTLVAERLAACANVLAEITSLFWWEGAVQEEPEVPVILKTRAELVDRVVERVKALHSYTCPCVVALPVAAGNPAFLDWIAGETAGA